MNPLQSPLGELATVKQTQDRSITQRCPPAALPTYPAQEMDALGAGYADNPQPDPGSTVSTAACTSRVRMVYRKDNTAFTSLRGGRRLRSPNRNTHFSESISSNRAKYRLRRPFDSTHGVDFPHRDNCCANCSTSALCQIVFRHSFSLFCSAAREQNCLAVSELSEQNITYDLGRESLMIDAFILLFPQQYIPADRPAHTPKKKKTVLRKKGNRDSLFPTELDEGCRHRHLTKTDNSVNADGRNTLLFHAANLDTNIFIPTVKIALRGKHIKRIEQLLYNSASPLPLAPKPHSGLFAVRFTFGIQYPEVSISCTLHCSWPMGLQNHPVPDAESCTVLRTAARSSSVSATVTTVSCDKEQRSLCNLGVVHFLQTHGLRTELYLVFRSARTDPCLYSIG